LVVLKPTNRLGRKEPNNDTIPLYSPSGHRKTLLTMEHVNLNELFERMSREEMEAYAKDGLLPPWFEQAVGATGSDSRGGSDEQ
jgi:hypothetical protein